MRACPCHECETVESRQSIGRQTLRQSHNGTRGAAPCSPLHTRLYPSALKVGNSTLYLTTKGPSFIQIPCSDVYWAVTVCQALSYMLQIPFLIYSLKKISEVGNVPKHIESLSKWPKLTLKVGGKSGLPTQVSLTQTFTPVWALL